MTFEATCDKSPTTLKTFIDMVVAVEVVVCGHRQRAALNNLIVSLRMLSGIPAQSWCWHEMLPGIGRSRQPIHETVTGVGTSMVGTLSKLQMCSCSSGFRYCIPIPYSLRSGLQDQILQARKVQEYLRSLLQSQQGQAHLMLLTARFDTSYCALDTLVSKRWRKQCIYPAQ
ncbi:hypothetical protein E2P81_ATG08761 [Venturia nashicola]|uniref:Uncharacterized protein n=1 Tax=Venturia nashicola TaxID=86259 RepID=A0A4Z1P2Q8_9PEZI|nr:hypothetical protein E6O75_ATG08956 [Venturia nashicola]TLD23417.1 hypothetical protein E2P81_ATG08761 [Venturia nashicola]